MREHDEDLDVPILRGTRKGVLTRQDFEMMVLLSTGMITEEGDYLCARGYKIGPLEPEGLRIRKLQSLGVVATISGTVLPTPEAGELMVRSAKKYGFPLEKVQRTIKETSTTKLIREREQRLARGEALIDEHGRRVEREEPEV